MNTQQFIKLQIKMNLHGGRPHEDRQAVVWITVSKSRRAHHCQVDSFNMLWKQKKNVTRKMEKDRTRENKC